MAMRNDKSEHLRKAQANRIVADMKRIDEAIATADFDALMDLHVDLDGTYHNRIKSWGRSMYGFMKEMGFAYECLGVESLRHNLKAMKAELRGFLFDIDPNADNSVFTENASNLERDTVRVERTDLYNIITKKQFDVAREYARIWKLFNSGAYLGERVTSLRRHVDGCLQFFPDSFKNRALSLDDFNDTFGFKFRVPDELVTKDELISYCEYVITLCDYLWEYASEHLEYDTELLRDYLYQTVESCMDELGLIPVKRDLITIYVEKDSAVLAAAELVDESLSYDIKSYIHKQTKGNLQKKKTILKFMADEIEPKRKILNANNQRGLADMLFQMLNRFIRHNNDDNTYINGLGQEELEAWYDDIYQLWLLAALEIDNFERKKRVTELLGKINTPKER